MSREMFPQQKLIQTPPRFHTTIFDTIVNWSRLFYDGVEIGQDVTMCPAALETAGTPLTASCPNMLSHGHPHKAGFLLVQSKHPQNYRHSEGFLTSKTGNTYFQLLSKLVTFISSLGVHAHSHVTPSFANRQGKPGKPTDIRGPHQVVTQRGIWTRLRLVIPGPLVTSMDRSKEPKEPFRLPFIKSANIFTSLWYYFI